MKIEDTKNLMCPFQNHPEKTIMCIADKCMAWHKDGGYCILIHGLEGWLSIIADRMPTR